MNLSGKNAGLKLMEEFEKEWKWQIAILENHEDTDGQSAENLWQP